MSQKESWSIVTPEDAATPPPYEDANETRSEDLPPPPPPKSEVNTGDQTNLTERTPPETPSIFCCPHLPEIFFADARPGPTTSLSDHPTVYTTRWLRQSNTDKNIDIKYNRFFLWAGHGISGDSPPRDGKPGKSRALPSQTFNIAWMYTVEVLDYRYPGPAQAQHFVSRDQKKGFEPFPYGRGNGVRIQNLDLKSSMLLKCTQHGHFFEVNLYW